MWRSKQRLDRNVVGALLLLSVAGMVGWAQVNQAQAGDVRGQLVLGSVAPTAAPQPPRAAYNWELENGVKQVVPTRVPAARELAVVLLGKDAPREPNPRVEVALSGGALLPSTLVVRSGTTLRIRNDDEIGHELYAQGLEGFSAEATSPGATRSIHLVTTGNWPLHDNLAPHATGELYVLANLAARAKVEPSGAFSFANVTPGKYTLKVFHGADEVASMEIDVPDKTVTLDPITFRDPKAKP